MKSPKLTCVVTGQSRVTSENYLNDKAKRLGKTTNWLLENYISKHACSKLRQGTPLSKLTDAVISDSLLTELVKTNSKCREEFTFVDGVYTPSKAKVVKEPKAPKVVKVTEPSKTLEDAVTQAVTNAKYVGVSNKDSKYEWDPELETTVLKTSNEILSEMVTNKEVF